MNQMNWAVEALEQRAMLSATVTAMPLLPTGNVNVAASTVDREGNLLVAGNFHDTVDFNPSSRKSYVLRAGRYWGAVFVAKYTADGRLIWVDAAYPRGPEDMAFEARALAVDGQGAAYVAGNMNGSADFDPTERRHVLTSSAFAQNPQQTSENDTFVWKVSGKGVFQRAMVVSGSSGDIEQVNAIEVDRDGNIVLGGGHLKWPEQFGQTFVLKLDRFGQQVWNTTVGGGYVLDMVLDGAGRAQVVTDYGLYVGTHVIQLSGSGAIEWDRNFDQGVPNLYGRISGVSLDRDADGNAYLAGKFVGTVDFNPGEGQLLMRSARKSWDGTASGFVLKLDESGDLKWARQFGGGTGPVEASAVRVSDEGRVFVTGAFTGSGDFDPGKGVRILYSDLLAKTSNFNRDVFLATLDRQGRFTTARAMGAQTTHTQFPQMAVTPAGWPVIVLDPVYYPDQTAGISLDAPIWAWAVNPHALLAGTTIGLPSGTLTFSGSAARG